jgi:hypothetical protein
MVWTYCLAWFTLTSGLAWGPLGDEAPTASPRPPATEPPKSDFKLPPIKRTGRPGDLTPEEDARITQIIDRFILHDVGLRSDPQAVREFRQLGPEAIPPLVRGFNKAITLNHSCPASMIYQKLGSLIRSSDDRQVLAFIRNEVGAGVPHTPYAGLVNNLKVMSSMRAAQVARLKTEPPRTPHPGGRSPGEQDPP